MLQLFEILKQDWSPSRRKAGQVENSNLLYTIILIRNLPTDTQNKLVPSSTIGRNLLGIFVYRELSKIQVSTAAAGSGSSFSNIPSL